MTYVKINLIIIINYVIHTLLLINASTMCEADVIILSRFWCMICVVETLNPGNRDERVAQALHEGG